MPLGNRKVLWMGSFRLYAVNNEPCYNLVYCNILDALASLTDSRIKSKIKLGTSKNAGELKI